MSGASLNIGGVRYVLVRSCVVVEKGHEIGVVKPGTAQKSLLMAVFVYIYISGDKIVYEDAEIHYEECAKLN
jgi:hypothetical protein